MWLVAAVNAHGWSVKMVPAEGIEPPTFGLQSRNLE